MKRNVTLSLEEKLISQGKQIALRKETTLSRLVGDYLKQVVEDEKAYATSKKKALDLLKSGYHWGGKIPCTREELHAR